jgi:thiamine biosynthesis lipoprotein
VVAGLPLGDPQFWVATALAAGALALIVWRLARTARASPALPCERCPRAAAHPTAAAEAPGPARRGLRVLLAAAALGAGEAGADELVERTVAAMGTTLRIEILAPTRGAGLALSEGIVREVAATEAALSTWRADSELARFNAAPAGARLALSPLLFAALAGALECAEATDGAFDPTIAPLAEAWGLRAGGRTPGLPELALARAATGYRGRLELESAGRRATKRRAVRIDEGGFGKGVALDRALALARESGARVRLDFGGQLAWSGWRGPQRLRLADPARRDRAVLEIEIDRPSGSLASSGSSERPGHLLDPRTGFPVAGAGSAAVLAASAAAADCRSTALAVEGRRGIVRLAAQRTAEGVYLEPVAAGRLVVAPTPGLRAAIRPLAQGVSIEPSKRSS